VARDQSHGSRCLGQFLDINCTYITSITRNGKIQGCGLTIPLTRRWLALLTIAVAVAAFSPGAGKAETPAAPPSAEKDKPVIVFAAASMKTALDAVAAAWTANTGKTASIAYASSAVLAKQIEQGAPADIFISADLKWMDYLDKAKLIRAGTRRKLFGNKLVLIAPADADAKLEIAKGFDLAGAAGDGKIAVCTLNSCPGGIYAKEALESLGVFASVETKLAQAGDIRSALNLVSRGEAKFGIVYATDAKADPKVKVVGTFPASSHSPIVYPVALVEASQNPDAAFFLAYLTSQAAIKIFTEQGFDIVPK
jgi:molybdate transport system substrate-binding protein